MTTFRIIFYGLMAFSQPNGDFEALIYDARSNAQILPGVFVPDHELNIRVVKGGTCSDGNKCLSLSKNEIGPFQFTFEAENGKDQSGEATNRREMDLLPKLPKQAGCGDIKKCGLLATVRVAVVNPFVCHEVHNHPGKSCELQQNQKSCQRREFTLADLGDKPNNIFGLTYKPMGDAVEVRFKAKSLKIGRSGPDCEDKCPSAEVKPKCNGENCEVWIVVSNAPVNGDSVDSGTPDISAHYSLLYNLVFGLTPKFSKFEDREVPTHWGGKGQMKEWRSMACEDVIEATKPRRFYPHDPAACIPPRYGG